MFKIWQTSIDILWKPICSASDCSIMGKLLCYHASDLDSIPWGGHTNRSPYLLVLHANSAFHPFEICKWVPHKTGATSGSPMMRVAFIGNHWWYDQQLNAYDPGSVGYTHINLVDGISIEACIVNLIKFCRSKQIVCVDLFKPR